MWQQKGNVINPLFFYCSFEVSTFLFIPIKTWLYMSEPPLNEFVSDCQINKSQSIVNLVIDVVQKFLFPLPTFKFIGSKTVVHLIYCQVTLLIDVKSGHD